MADTVQGAGTTRVDEEPHKLPVKTLVSASIGNAVEWFDWTVYATFVVFFAGQFFPAENEALALIGATSAYALAFFFRPLGGLLLGRFADLRGPQGRNAAHHPADGRRLDGDRDPADV